MRFLQKTEKKQEKTHILEQKMSRNMRFCSKMKKKQQKTHILTRKRDYKYIYFWFENDLNNIKMYMLNETLQAKKNNKHAHFCNGK